MQLAIVCDWEVHGVVHACMRACVRASVRVRTDVCMHLCKCTRECTQAHACSPPPCPTAPSRASACIHACMFARSSQHTSCPSHTLHPHPHPPAQNELKDMLNVQEGHIFGIQDVTDDRRLLEK